MHRRLLVALGSAALALTFAAPAAAQLPPLPGLPTLPGVPQIPLVPTPPGLPFSPEAVPNVERDCGETPTTAPALPADPRGVNPAAPNPLAADRFFVDPTEPSYKDMQRYADQGKTAQATAMSRLALAPKARWMGRFTAPNFQRKVRNYINCVQTIQPGATPLIVVMRHQGKECNARYQAGGVAEDDASKRWYRDFAEAVGDSRVVLAFEPDSIGTISCLAKSRRAARVGDAARRGRCAVATAERDDLPGGHRLGLEARQLDRLGCCAGSAWPRCAASWST